DWFGDYQINSAPFDLFINKTGAYKYGNDSPYKGNGGKSEILQNPQILTQRKAAQQQSGQGYQKREEQKHVQNSIPHRFSERVASNCHQRSHLSYQNICAPTAGRAPDARYSSSASCTVFRK